MIKLPRDHPDRIVLAEEVHARPYAELQTPERATYVALLVPPGEREREREHIAALCARFGAAVPPPEATHFTVPLASMRLKWERHGEFSSYTFFAQGVGGEPFAKPAGTLLPVGWLSKLPGETIVAAHAELVATAPALPSAAELAQHFEGNVVVGAEIGDGAGVAYTDFRIHADGYARFLVLDRSFTPRQAGRMLQRLFEIESYRMMALLALPLARKLAPVLASLEQRLGTLTSALARADQDDETLLAALSPLAAETESALSSSQYRFGASTAYYDLVRSRIAELRERRIAGLQTIDEFMGRRLAPAMATCASVSRRLRELSERIAQASGLLSTRVEIAREKQNQALLASMDRRARTQLRLQQTVEGLSIAAITYYAVGLVAYGLKALKAGGVPVDAELGAGLAIPVVAGLAWLIIRRVRTKIEAGD